MFKINRMKNIIIVLLTLCIGLAGLNSCAPDYETEFEVMSLVVPDESLAPISFPIEGGAKKAVVETNVAQEKWTVTSNADWLTAKKSAGQVDITAVANNTFDTRIGQITISYGHQTYNIPVSQGGKTPLLLVEGVRQGVERVVPAQQSTVTVTVNSNMNVDNILITDTAKFVHVASIADVPGKTDEKTLTLSVDLNLSRNTRYSTVTVQSSDNYNHTASFLITQAGITFVQLPLTADMLSSNAQEPNEGPIQNLLDGNPGTFFHSAWSFSIPVAHNIQVKLNEPINGCIFWYQNRNNGNGKPIDVTIDVSADGETWTELTHIVSGLPTAAGSTYESAYLASDTPFTYFRYTVHKTNSGTAPTFFNMAEFKMFIIAD